MLCYLSVMPIHIYTYMCIIILHRNYIFYYTFLTSCYIILLYVAYLTRCKYYSIFVYYYFQHTFYCSRL